jgi:hypothetical protein
VRAFEAILISMYRDDSTFLDEHDRAVGAIQIADELINACMDTSKRLSRAEHRWRAVNEIQDEYAELWRQLDSARRLLSSRGANTMQYDELRDDVVSVLKVRDDGVDTKPLGDARRAVEALRLAMPGADWKAIEARTRRLTTGTTFMRRGQKVAFAGVVVVFLCAVATWAASSIPGPKINSRAEARIQMRKELAVVVDERRDRIDQLELLIGGRCDRRNVMEYVKLLAMEGRYDKAYGYGEDYTARCGADPEVSKWSRFAKKKLDRLSSR